MPDLSKRIWGSGILISVKILSCLKPKSQLGKIVHVADYLASRKDIDISFKDDTDAYDLPDIKTYKCPYKKHKDELLTDVAKTDPEYLEWLHENVNMREPMKTFVNELLKSKTN